MPPAQGTTEGVGKPPEPPCPNPGPTPLTPCKESAPSPPWGESKGICYFFSLHPCYNRGPRKALPEFLVWPLINFY